MSLNKFHQLQYYYCEKLWKSYVLSCLTVEAKEKYGITVYFEDALEMDFDNHCEEKWLNIEVVSLRNGKVKKTFGVLLKSFKGYSSTGVCEEAIVTRNARKEYLSYIRQINSLFIGHYVTRDGLYVYDRKKFENSDDYGMVYVSRDDDDTFHHVSHDDYDCSCVGRGCEVCLPMY